MFNTLSSISIHPYVYVPVVVILSCAIANKVAQMVTPIFKRITSSIYNSILITNIKGFFCTQCANIHRKHLTPSSQENEVKDFTRTVKVLPDPPQVKE